MALPDCVAAPILNTQHVAYLYGGQHAPRKHRSDAIRSQKRGPISGANTQRTDTDVLSTARA
eukprot:9025281-Pyramimonas_sp.AAC.1